MSVCMYVHVCVSEFVARLSPRPRGEPIRHPGRVGRGARGGWRVARSRDTSVS